MINALNQKLISWNNQHPENKLPILGAGARKVLEQIADQFPVQFLAVKNTNDSGKARYILQAMNAKTRRSDEIYTLTAGVLSFLLLRFSQQAKVA